MVTNIVHAKIVELSRVCECECEWVFVCVGVWGLFANCVAIAKIKCCLVYSTLLRWLKIGSLVLVAQT